MRRLFIIRKDLNLGPGKLAAMVAHCAEAYWLEKIKRDYVTGFDTSTHKGFVKSELTLTTDEFDGYVNDIFTKTICEAKNLNQLNKAKDIALEMGLVEGKDFGFIDDCCKTDLTPEFLDEHGVGRCRVGIWFKPLSDDDAHKISKKFKLYHD